MLELPLLVLPGSWWLDLRECAALLQAGVLFVMTHDSIGLGEDGPTHQPIEHLASFRAMPNMLTMRPGDGNETAGAYKVITALENLDLAPPECWVAS